jgi:hypothetical protein
MGPAVLMVRPGKAARTIRERVLLEPDADYLEQNWVPLFSAHPVVTPLADRVYGQNR